MKITGVEKHLHSKLSTALWSVGLLCFVIVGAIATLFLVTPQNVTVKMNARGLSEGTRTVAVRAVNTTDPANILYMGTTPAVVQDGQLSANFKPPFNLIGKSYVVEICTTKSGVITDSCFTPASTAAKPKIASEVVKSDQALYSCPYYVSEQKMTRLANLTNRNIVEADNRISCGSETVEGSSANVEFNTSSPVQVMQSTQPQGLTVEGSGIVVAENGALKTMSVDELRSQLTISQQPTIQYVVAPSADSTALTLVGRTLGLTNGSSVLLPEDMDTTYPVANSTTDGIISSADWNIFANKENSLTFDAGLLRSGNTIGLMSCTAGQILKNDGTTWVCAADAGSSLGSYTAGTGIAISGANVISNTGVLNVTASGALTSSGGQNPAITLATTADFTQLASQLALANTGVTAGTYNNVTVDAKGRVTAGTNVSYLTTEGDGVVGNEVTGVVSGGGLVLSGTGSSLDPYKVGLITSCASTQLLKWNGSAWACATDIDTDTNTDAQTLTYNTLTNTLTLGGGTGGGGVIDLSALKDNTDSQAISRTGNTISITGSASTVDLTPYIDNTDSQTLTITNPSAGNHSISISGGNSQSWNESQVLSYDTPTRTISLTNGGSIVLPVDQNTTYTAGNGLTLASTVFSINAPTCAGTDKLQWNGTAFVCAADVDTNTDTQTLSWNNGTRTLTISGSASSVVIPDANSGGTVTGITAGTGLTGGTITTSGTIALATSGVTAGSYGSGTLVPVISVDQYGRITSASTSAIPTASTATTGLLTSTDWNSFNGKENVLTFSDGLARASNTVTLMDCAANQILQRNSGDTAWLCANQVVDTNTTYTAGTGISLVGTTLSNTGVLSVSASGALTSSGGQSPAISLATTGDLQQISSQLGLTNTGVSAGTYNGITVDAKGRVTAATQMNYLTSFTEVDGVVGNEVAGVVTNGGLVMTGAGTSGDPYKLGLITSCADGRVLKYTAAGGWACATDIDTDTNTDAQTLTWNGGTNTLTLGGGTGGGGVIDLSALNDNTDSQAISLSGDTLSITGNASTVDLSGYKDNTDNQTVSWNNGTRTLSLTNGGSVVIPDADTTYTAGDGLSLTSGVFAITAPTCTGATAKLLWSGTAFTCGTDVDTNTTYSAGSGITLTGTTFSLAQNGATNGQVLMWNSTNGAWEPTTPNSFTDTDAQNLSYNAATRVLSIDRGTGVTFPLADGVGANPGLLSQADWNSFNGKESVLTFSDGLTRTSNNVTLMDCAANQIVQRNSGDSAWVCANQVVDTNTTYSAGTGISLGGTTFSNSGVLSVGASGALTSSGGQNPSITLATTSDLQQLGSQLGLTDTGVSAGTYNNVTVDAKGRVTSASNVSYLTAETDAVIGNEVANVVSNGGLVMTGSGTSPDPYKVGLVTTCSAGQLLKYYPTDPDGAGPLVAGWNCASDVDTNTDAQTLTWNTGTNILDISGGNSVDLTSLKDNTDSQAISLAGNTLSISGNASTVNLAGYLDNTDNQALSWTAGTRTLSLSNGGSVVISDADTTYSAGTGITLTGTTFTLTNDFGTSIDSSEITNGTIAAADLANSGATAGTYGDTGVNVAQVTVNAQGQVASISNRALPTANTTTTGVLSSTDWNTFNGKENVLTFSGNGLFSRTGDTISGTTCATTGHVLKWNGSAFACAADVDTDTNTTYTGSGGITLTGTNFTLTNDFGASIDSGEITDGTIANADLAASSVNSGNIVDSSIASADIASGAVTTSKLASCSTNGQILKYYATDPDGAGPLAVGWNCDTDVDTNTDAVSSVFGRTGAVTAQSGDYTANKITNTPSGTIAASDVQAALNELDSEKLAITLASGKIWVGGAGGNATAVSMSGDATIDNLGAITIAANAVALGTDTTGNYVADVTAGNGISVSGTAGEGWSPSIAINAPTCTGGQYLTWSGSAFTCGTPTDTDTTNFNIRANAGASANIASGGTISFIDGTGTTATRTSNDISFNLTNVGTAGTYGSATAVPVITTDAQGRVTGVTSTPINFPAEVDGVIGNEVTNATTNGGLTRGGSGTGVSPYTLGLLTTCSDQQVLKYTLGTTTWGCANDSGGTSYTASNGITLTGSNFTLTNDFGSSIDSSEITNGTIAAADLANSGATAGTYADTGVNVAQLTVNAQGQVTAVSNRALPTADTGTTGVLSSTDWNTFNGKENVLTFSDGLTRVSNGITLMDCAANQILQRNAGDTAWACANQVVDTNTTYTNGTGLSLGGTTFSITNTTVTAASYAPADNANGSVAIPQFTVNAQGQLTAASTTNVTITGITSAQVANGTLVSADLSATAGITNAQLANSAITWALGTTGTDVNWGAASTALGGTATLNIPDASATARGLVTTGTQTLAGDKTFTGLTFFNATGATTGDGVLIDTPNLTTGNALSITGPTESGLSNDSILRARSESTFGFNDAQVIVGSGDTNNPEGLARDQLYVFGRINSSWNSFTQDFVNFQSNVAADGNYQNGFYDETIGTGGTSPSGQIQMQNVTGTSGVARLTFTGTLGTGPWASNWGTGGNLVTQRSLNPVFEARVQASANTDVRHVVGFTDLALGGTVNANTNNSANEAFFRKTAAGTNWEAVTRNTSGTENITTLATACSGGTACTTSAMRRLRVEVTNIGANGTVYFFVDGTLVATHNTTAVPASTNRLGWVLAVTPTTTTYTGRTLDMDYVRVWSDDPPTGSQVNSSVIDAIVDTTTAEANGVATTEVQAELSDEAKALEAQLPGVVIDNSGTLDQMKLASGLLAKITALDARITALETKSTDIASAIWKGGIVTDDTTFNGLVTFNSNVVFSGNNAGTVTIPTGETTATVIYKSTQPATPRVVATPQDFITGPWRVTSSTAAGFTIELQQAQTQAVTLDWHAFASQ